MEGISAMKRFQGIALLALAFVTTGQLCAAGYPARPVRMVVPFAAGGTATILARSIANEAEKLLGQSIVVDNRGGANGIIGTQIVVNATPDGYTLLHVTTSVAINPSVYRKLPYDTLKDLVPISFVARGTGYVLLASPGFRARTVKELIEEAKKPGKPVAYASAGIGNSTHLVAEIFSRAAGIEMTHVAYKGVAPAINAVMGGEVPIMFIPPTIAVGHIKAGRVRALGFTGKSRWAVLPDIPTIAEAGVAGFYKDSGWNVWFAPAKTPANVVQYMQSIARKSVYAPKVRKVLDAGGYEPFANTPAEARVFLRSEIKTYANIVRAVGIKPN